MLLPPGVAEGELNAGVDAGVAVSEGCARDVDGVSTEVDGAAGADEVVSAYATLWGEVPDAGVSVGAVVLFVVGWSAKRWVFVVCPEKAPGGLAPEGKPLGADHVPTKDDRRDGYSGKSSAYGVERCAYRGSADWVCAERPLEFWSVGLPEWEELDCVLEVAAERASAVVARQNFAGVNARQEEFEVVTVFGDAEATLNESAYFEVLKT